jgi:hypothetical protein
MLNLAQGCGKTGVCITETFIGTYIASKVRRDGSHAINHFRFLTQAVAWIMED